MTDQNTTSLDAAPNAGIDIGRPIAWMVDPEQPDVVLGVTYAFTVSQEHKTVWYTQNKRKPKAYAVLHSVPV